MKINSLKLAEFTKFIDCFSDQSRVRIINLLVEKKKLYVGQIQNALQFSQTKTSRHLLYMKNAGVLKSQRDKQNRFIYFINPEIESILFRVISCAQDSVLYDDIKRLDKVRSEN